MIRSLSPWGWSLLVIAAITLFRVVALAFNQVDVFMDEAQYWLWGQEPAFGHYSKPPMVGWAIRAANELGGSDSAFWIRLPSVLAYGVTAVILAQVSRELWDDPRAAWAGAAFATLPGVAVLAQLVSTDDMLLLFLALVLWAHVRLQGGAGLGWAILLGLGMGLGLMSKYAMAFAAGLVILVELAWPSRRIGRQPLATALGVAALCVLPNLIWNISNDFITFTHTGENAGWAGIAWNWVAMVEFLLAQIISFGPILGFAFLVALWRARGPKAYLALFSVPIFLAIAGQALIRDANANWAAMGFVAGTVLVAGWLARAAPRVFAASMVVNVALAVVVPLAAIWPEAARFGERSVFDRAMGVSDFSQAVFAVAEEEGVTTIVAGSRVTLADLTYRSKGTNFEVFARQPGPIPANHYELTRPLPNGRAPVLFVTSGPVPASCETGPPLLVWDVETGGLRKQIERVYLLQSTCL